MKKTGYFFFAIGLATAAAIAILDSVNIWLIGIFAGCIILAIALIGSDAAARLYRGEVKLRPWLAAKKFLLVFLVVLGLMLIASNIFPSYDFVIFEAVIKSASIATVLSLSQTAYRKHA